MDNFGLDMQGVVLVQRIERRQDWTPDDVGRMILDYETGKFWLGGKNITFGENGWVTIGMSENDIKHYMIDWDNCLEGVENKTSALNIPCLYGDTTTVLQTAVNSILDEITALSKGEIIQATAIKSYHLDINGTYRIDARIIPIENLNGYFSSGITTVEDALIHLIQQQANNIPLESQGGFGEQIGFTSQTIQEALVDIEGYLKTFSADSVSATYPLASESSTVQFVLDAHYQLLQNINFKDLLGTPNNYGSSGQIIKTDGVDSLCYNDLVANDVNCQYPDTAETNVQSAIWGMQQDIYDIQSQISSHAILDAEQVTYNGSAIHQDVDSALDWLLSNSYTPENSPLSSDIVSLGIGDTENVQDSLVHLQDQFNSLLSQIPCQLVSENVSYNSVGGHTNVKNALDYLFSVI